ncbi:MAG: molybdopterin-binding protein [Treponema sp.]|nr:molybdopterin-binding protein [Treponema sp.]
MNVEEKIKPFEKPAFKEIKTKDSIGHILCHDITQIIPGTIKDARFRKGHIVREEDIPVLLSMGKDKLYVWEEIHGFLHENEAAKRLAAICENKFMRKTQVKEGKIELVAETGGLFTVDCVKLNAINSIGQIAIASRHTNTSVKSGDTLLGVRVIPLVIAEAALEKAEAITAGISLAAVIPWKLKTAAIVTTGNEVFHGRIKDAFTPVVLDKLAKFGITVIAHKTVGDDSAGIQKAILEVREVSPDLILCTGGMSVDPDDRTPAAISAVCQNIVCYGTPVLPGSMLMMGYFEDSVPVLGLPGCVMYHKPTVFDLVLPRIAAGLSLSSADFAAMGHGGLCHKCEQCYFPDCAFGK